MCETRILREPRRVMPVSSRDRATWEFPPQRSPKSESARRCFRSPQPYSMKA